MEAEIVGFKEIIFARREVCHFFLVAEALLSF